MFFFLEPEVAGEIGGDSIVDNSVHPPRVSKLHYVMDGWLGDDILESFPCYIVTDRIRREVEQQGMTGCEFHHVEVTPSEQFMEIYPGRKLPHFSWLQVRGNAGVDDFALADDCRIVVSERALALMREVGRLENCEIDNYP